MIDFFERKMPLILMDLDSLLHRVTLETFVKDYFEQSPFCVRASSCNSLSVNEWFPEEVMARTTTSVRICNTNEDKELSSGTGNPKTLLQQGWSIVIPKFHTCHSRFDLLVRELRKIFGGDAHAVYFATPKSGSAFDFHFDVDNVFVVQLFGTKRWLLGGTEIRFPIPQLSSLEQIIDRSSFEEVTLNAGDILYVPAGVIHKAVSESEISIHVTLGWSPKRASAVAKSVVDEFVLSCEQVRKSVISISRGSRAKEIENIADRFRKAIASRLIEEIGLEESSGRCTRD